MITKTEQKGLIFQKKYKVLDGYEVSKRIEKIFEKQCPLTDYQKSWLRRELGDSGVFGNLDMPFQAYEWEKIKDKENGFWKILGRPLAVIIVVILAIIVCPVKYLFTGKYGFYQEGKISARFWRWLDDVL